MKKIKIVSTSLAIASLLILSCKKERPENASPQEQPLPTINQGNGVIETVQRGPNGANVVFSNWITKTEADWTGFGTTEIKTDIITASLTDAIRNQGVVLVYLEYPNNYVYLLPYVRLEYNQVLDYSFISGKITLSVRITGSIIGTGISDLRFRYVLIPSSSFGNTASGRMSRKVDYKDYNAVCEYFGIPK